MTTTITFEIDTDHGRLENWTDEHLACLFAISQANPAPFGDLDAGHLAGAISSEIIRRWLKQTPLPRHHHQAKDFGSKTLSTHGRFLEPDYKTWAPHTKQEGGAE